jgi:ABC-type polysaccharide/polyol phosphate export permease
MAPAFLRPVIQLNPLSPFIEATRAALLDARGPSWVELGLMGFWLVVTGVTGIWVFSRLAPRFAEEA